MVISSYSLTLCNVFLDFLACHGLVQMNLQPTKYNSILDVFLTGQPLSISSINILPGISDHKAVLVKSDMSIKNSPTIKGKGYVWGKADRFFYY